MSENEITKEDFEKLVLKKLSIVKSNILGFFLKDIDYAEKYLYWTEEKSIKNKYVYFNRDEESSRNRPRKTIWWTELGYNVGTELNSDHFSVVIKEFKYTAIVIPISSVKEDTRDWKESEEFIVSIGCLKDLPREKRPSYALVNQIRTISKKRLSTYYDKETDKYIKMRLTDDQMNLIDEKIALLHK